MKIKPLLIILIVIILAGAGALIFLVPKTAEVTYVNNYPDLIQIDYPGANAIIQSPIAVTGRARGTWYFEASFPVRLEDANGNQVAVVPAEAKGDWMTTDFVPFSAVLTFAPPTTKTGTLILKNDNPSGLPANDKEVRIPVQFADYKPGGKVSAAVDYKNATYIIDNQSVTLANGVSIIPAAPGSDLNATTQVFGNEVKGDLNGDGLEDVAFILTQNGGGTGTFYYAVVALKTASGYEGTNGILLGDRIAPQTTEIHNGELIVNYADRKPDEPFTAKPTVGVSKYLKIQDAELVEIPQTINSGITGYVHMGPTCPVERIPPDPKCADKAYADAKVEITLKSSGVLAKSLVSDATGSFQADLSPGIYTITAGPKIGVSMPRCNPIEATVTANKVVSVDISCDTGIR